MVYTNTPLRGERPTDSQERIRVNFADLNTIFTENHVALTAAADLGKHTVVAMTRQAAPGSAADEVVVYQKLSGGSSELFFQRDNVITQTQLTGGGITAAAYCSFTNVANPVVLANSFNVPAGIGSVLQISDREFRIVFTRAFDSVNYVAIFTPTTAALNSPKTVTKATGECNVIFSAAPIKVDCVFFGILA